MTLTYFKTGSNLVPDAFYGKLLKHLVLQKLFRSMN